MAYVQPLPDPLSAYLDQRETNRKAGLQDLQGAVAAQGLLSKIQSQQELAQIKETVAQAGGDPAKASEALIKLGSPQALKLGIEMRSLLPKPAEPFSLPRGSRRFDPSGKMIAENPAELTPPTTRTRISGDISIQEEFDRTTGTWREVGRGPRFSKQVGDDSPYSNVREDPLHPGKFVGLNRKTGKIEQVPDSLSRPTIDTSLKGEDFLKSLDPLMATQVKAIAEGRQPIPTGFAMRSPYWQNIMSMVSQYDPSYNVSRQQVYKDFTSGLSARNITAMNTAIAHMGTMDKLADALKNNDVQAVNAAVNFTANALGRPEVNNYNLAGQAVSDELMRVFRQVNASQMEAEEFRKKFGNAVAARSPEQMKGALKTASELLRGRLDAVNDQWKRGMNKETDFPNIISPQSRDTLRKLGVELSGDKPVEFNGYTFPNQDALDRYKRAAGISG